MTVIRRLSSHLINQIAAGEVVERPASVVKELVENAIDAGATRVDVTLREGGASFIQVMDNGCGMEPEDLMLATERHATSKLPHENLFDIKTLGFRGEALPSIGAISRLSLMSRQKDAENGWRLSVDGGVITPLEPLAMAPGTTVEVRDLFYAVPARLKFLKTPQTELNHIVDILERLSLVHSTLTFTLKTEHRTVMELKGVEATAAGLLTRCHAIMGNEFDSNALEVNRVSGGFALQGFISVPTLNRVNAQCHYFYVNGRPVRDKIFSGAVRAAYRDLLAHDRHPLLGLFLTVPSADVDINVHPTKAEVRFRDPGFIRHFVANALSQTLATVGHTVSTHVASSALSRMTPAALGVQMTLPTGNPRSSAAYTYPSRAPSPTAFTAHEPTGFYVPPLSAQAVTADVVVAEDIQPLPLGRACVQLHDTYIVSETHDGLIIVDQHAAHERLVYERLKEDVNAQGVKRQILLIPEVVELNPREHGGLLAHVEEMHQWGLVVEEFGPGAVVVREVPALLGSIDIKSLVRDLAHDIAEHGVSYKLSENVHAVCSLMACHGSTRAGRKMSVPEMNDLLRSMESTPYSGQCNHGRPTHIVLKLKDIETLFGRR